VPLDFLQRNLASGQTFVWQDVAVRLGLAALAGLAVAAAHRVALRPRRAGPLNTTLPLLSALIAMVTMAVGDNAARAFALAGALSIVRFRTVVEDTRDTAFVIFAVAVGMTVGAGQALAAAIGFVTVAALALVVREWNAAGASPSAAKPPEGPRVEIAVRLGGGQDAVQVCRAALADLAEDLQLVSVRTGKRGAAAVAVFRARLRDVAEMPAALAALQAQPGVQRATIRRTER
jgi:hypothetical protein